MLRVFVCLCFGVARFSCWMSKVFGFGKISCDSARRCNFIFPLPKKNLRAASSRTPFHVLRAFPASLRCASGFVVTCVAAGFNQTWLFCFSVCFCFNSEPLNLLLQSVTLFLHCEQCFSLWCTSAQGWHTQSVLKCYRDLTVSTESIFMWHFKFQAAPPKGGRVGSTYFSGEFFFLSPPHPTRFWWEHHFSLFWWEHLFFVSQNMRGTPFFRCRVFSLFPRKRAAWIPHRLRSKKKERPMSAFHFQSVWCESRFSMFQLSSLVDCGFIWWMMFAEILKRYIYVYTYEGMYIYIYLRARA